ncbi:MAG: hypothetical protein ACYCO9_17230 [Streptosporangiaceae bacterium]
MTSLQSPTIPMIQALGVGPDTAAEMLIVAGDNIGRGGIEMVLSSALA